MPFNNKEYQKNYYIINKEKIKKRIKKYRYNNKEKVNKWARAWRLKNSEKFKVYINKYYREKYHNNINYKIKKNCQRRILDCLNGKMKSISTMFLIGCEIDYLMYHIQNQFTTGMNWDNYGKWHIDHIRPCARFDLSKPEEQLKCFHFTNLQPLWAEDNKIKGKKNHGISKRNN